MKFDKNKAFPYPVLRPYSDDYVDVDFQTTVEFILDKDYLSVDITYTVSSEDILKEIKNLDYVYALKPRETSENSYMKEIIFEIIITIKEK